MHRRGVGTRSPGPLGVVVALALAVAGCGAGGAAPERTGATRTPQPLPIATPTTVAERCKVPFEGGALVDLRAPDGSVMTAATVGTGPTVAVYLHQTAPSGFCGWVSYAAWAAERGIRGVLVDLCGWGRARCTPALAADPEAQVRLAVDWARQQGAERVTVVGASMGGVIALGVGQQAGADAIVDLSGPFDGFGVPSAQEAAPLVTVPLLVAIAPGDRTMEAARTRAAFATAPVRTKRFVSTPGGHGWGMLNDGTDAEPSWTPLATTVLRWVRGEPA
ncbi:alpha/beta hydrolase [Phycicoccus sp. 3266]|uniref:alpha/beta hydrolase n=1 Tax=Phycicoccus sp. 3266 TaxID=2817751 RepID=UPI00285A7531|nr:alpha/beta hydrolase [Phycicoccus sp. 3266]MDR6862615.1 dienelactone hydrolase [Phycicoccus sp. 3266]